MSFNYILKNIWLGDHYSRKNSNFLRLFNISGIINCSRLNNYHYNNIKYYNLDLNDTIDDRERLYNSIIKYSKIIDKYYRTNRNILIHCEMGINRSAYLLAGYLILYHNLDRNQAKFYITGRRPICFQKKSHFDKVLKRIEKYKYLKKYNNIRNE